MWIMSQDKVILVNSDTITGIVLEDIRKQDEQTKVWELNHVKILACGAYRGGAFELGRYKTVDRAKKELSVLCDSLTNDTVFYSMPED